MSLALSQSLVRHIHLAHNGFVPIIMFTNGMPFNARFDTYGEDDVRRTCVDCFMLLSVLTMSSANDMTSIRAVRTQRILCLLLFSVLILFCIFFSFETCSFIHSLCTRRGERWRKTKVDKGNVCHWRCTRCFTVRINLISERTNVCTVYYYAVTVYATCHIIFQQIFQKLNL